MHTLVGDTKWDNYTVEAKIRLDEGKTNLSTTYFT